MNKRSLSVALGLWAVTAFVSSPVYAVDPQKPDPGCGTMAAFGEGMAGAMNELAHSIYAVSTALIPHADFRFDSDKRARFGARWSLQYAFGPEVDRTTYARKCTDDLVEIYRAGRLLLEPAITIGKVDGEWDVGFDVRPAVRFMNHREGRGFGIGAGFGTTIAFDDPVRASLSPELVFQVGACCDPSFFTLALRYDYFPKGEPSGSFGVSAGWTYW